MVYFHLIMYFSECVYEPSKKLLLFFRAVNSCLLDSAPPHYKKGKRKKKEGGGCPHSTVTISQHHHYPALKSTMQKNLASVLAFIFVFYNQFHVTLDSLRSKRSH